MNEYLGYMFEQYVMRTSSKEFNVLVKQDLLDMKQVQFTKIYKQLTTSNQLFNQLNLLMAKGVIKYSPANCTVELSLANVMVYQRLQKLIRFGYRSLHPHIAQFINQWIQQGIQNGMVGFPVMFEKSLISKVFHNSQLIPTQQQDKKKSATTSKQSNKQKPHLQPVSQQQKQSYNYHRLVYQYRSIEKTSLTNENDDKIISKQKQLVQEDKNKPLQQHTKKSKSIGKNTKDTGKKAQKQQPVMKYKQTSKQKQPQQQFQQYMLNLQQLTKLFQAQKVVDILNSRLGQKQKKITIFDFLALKQRETIIQQTLWEKQQQYISQILGQNCLLVFNLIKKYPYLTEKELIKMTLMEVLETRQALNQLLQKGLVYFYNENVRTIVYKVADPVILYKLVVDSIAKTILNLSLAAQRIGQVSTYSNTIEQVKNKLIQLQCEIQRLDDLLVLFGY